MNELNIEAPDGYVIDEENSSFNCIKFKKEEKKQVTCWEDLVTIKGFYTDSDANIHNLDAVRPESDYKNLFATKEQAEACIALAMLSQLMKDVNGDWTPDWANRLKDKFSIRFSAGEVSQRAWSVEQCFLAFPTEEIRDTFLENHEKLIMKAKPLL